MTLRIDMARLQADVEALSAIGRQRDMGLYRMAFSPGDMEARAWFQQRLADAGLEIFVDGAANIHGRLAWDGKTAGVMTGSHLDTIPGAGHLDGALGVVVGLECLRRIRELALPLSRPLEVVAFSDEEGRFGGMFGSQAICGHVTPQSIHDARDLNGVSLVDAMADVDLNAMDALRARRSRESVHAFVELHIEQGPILERRGIAVGAVHAIAGLFKWDARFIGQANHAGTTPMDMRQDAFQAVAEIACAIPRLLEENGGPQSVATIGRVELSPGAANVVPGVAEFSLEVRDTDGAVLAELAGAFRRAMSAIARRRDLMFEFDVLSEIEPVKCDAGIVDIVEAAAAELGVECLRMASGAAHDTQIMAGITRAGMVFVPSQAGRSHSPAEWTPWADIETGANVLLNTLTRLVRS